MPRSELYHLGCKSLARLLIYEEVTTQRFPGRTKMEECIITYSNWGSISWAIIWALAGIIIGIVLKAKVIK